MFTPIGYVENAVEEKVDRGWGQTVSTITIDSALTAGLTGLEGFSHVIVVYHLDQARFDITEHLVRRPQGRPDMPEVGIFAQRAKDRPNPLGVTAVRLIAVKDDGIVVQGLDAIDGTPVLDIKPYFPRYDLRADATVPSWVDVLMAGYF